MSLNFVAKYTEAVNAPGKSVELTHLFRDVTQLLLSENCYGANFEGIASPFSIRPHPSDRRHLGLTIAIPERLPMLDNCVAVKAAKRFNRDLYPLKKAGLGKITPIDETRLHFSFNAPATYLLYAGIASSRFPLETELTTKLREIKMTFES